MLPFLYEPRESAVTFAEPGAGASFLAKLANAPLLPVERDTAIDVALNVIKQPEVYRDLFNAAAKQTEFVDNAFARDLSREEAYDRRIKAVKDATGIALENPERWGYQQDAKRAVRNDLMASGGQGIDETGGIPAYRRRIFEQKLAELRGAHPDKSADLTFGNIDAEGRAIAKGAEDEYTRARSQPDLDPAGSLVTEFAGSMWGMRRDPLMVGSLFFGPTSAVGKAVVARIASAGLFQGLYNAGLSAIEQPAVQAWRDEVGLKSGVVPAVENVGLAFLFGAIPGAAFRGIHETARAPVKRVMEGRPEPGDAEAAIKAVGGEVSPQEAGAIKLGEEMDAAERLTRPPAPKDVSPELHDSLTTAAQRYADDPVNQPSPAAVEFIAQQRIGNGVFAEGNKAFIEGAPRGDYIRAISDGEARLPTTDELSTALAATRDADRKYSNAIGLTDAEHNKIRSLNRRIDQEGGSIADEAIKEKNAITDRIKDKDIYDLDIADEGELLQLLTEFRSLERSGNETAAEHFDGMARVLKRYIGGFTDGEPFARVVFRKAFEEAKAAGYDTKKLGNDVINRFMGDLSSSDQAFMRQEFEKFLRPKIEAPEITARVADANPQTQHEAQMAASEAIEDIGNRQSMAQTRNDLERYTLEETFDIGAEPPPARSKDPLDKIPMARDDGTPTLVSARQAARAGEREAQFADLIRECK